MKTVTLKTPETNVEMVDQTEWLNFCRKANKSLSWGLLNKPSRVVGEDWPAHAHRAAAEVECILP